VVLTLKPNLMGRSARRSYLSLITSFGRRGLIGQHLTAPNYSSNERIPVMRRAITILATALLASNLLTGAAEARGGGGFGGGHMGGIGAGAHIGGFAGAGHVGGFGSAVRMGGIGAGDHGFHEHAMHHLGIRRDSGVYDGYASHCYYPDEAPKLPPWPPYCS